MFISVLDLFKTGIGPSSSHTTGPMVAARVFAERACRFLDDNKQYCGEGLHLRCTLKGSLAFTGKGHATDRAVVFGLHGWNPAQLAECDTDILLESLLKRRSVSLSGSQVAFTPETDIIFDQGEALPQHPNGMVFSLSDSAENVLFSKTYFSIGGGFINDLSEIEGLVAPLRMESPERCPYPFSSAAGMLEMAEASGLSIAGMKLANELVHLSAQEIDRGLESIWRAMCVSVERGLSAEGVLPGGLGIERRAGVLHRQLLRSRDDAGVIDWLCAYAMAVNEENAAGHMVVTAPTNGAAGVIPAVLYYLDKHAGLTEAQAKDFLLTAAAIGGLIKHRSSISGAEVGCQGEVGSASAMAAAGLCAVRGGTPGQVENAAEIALEHHLGMTCDPVGGLVQVPCIERNGFGAVKAFTAASLALRGSGRHFMPLDSCLAAMKQTGLEMSVKFKETSLGGLAVSITEC